MKKVNKIKIIRDTDYVVLKTSNRKEIAKLLADEVYEVGGDIDIVSYGVVDVQESVNVDTAMALLKDGFAEAVQ